MRMPRPICNGRQLQVERQKTNGSYTNRGIGVIGIPMCYMYPPVITIFTLKKAT
jgi:predicted MPP superfamily phosphohydrolase